ncbi:MAG: 50S ribosomal protein L4 [Candidatus Cloacimonetes bacterium]|nr:50S ribosomal protein L4 [Candidatus Cloacimonadota bacterium]
MIEVVKLDKTGKEAGKIQLNPAIFDVEINYAAIKDLLLMQMANRRTASPNTKTRAEVAGGGRKPWKQKGTGRARIGSIRAPHWVGGGVANGPDSQNHKKSMPRKARRAALRSVLTDKVRGGGVVVMEDPAFTNVKTKEALSIVKNLGAEKVLFIESSREAQGFVGAAVKSKTGSQLELATRNLRGVKTLLYRNLNPHDLLNYSKVVILESALPRLEEVTL